MEIVPHQTSYSRYTFRGHTGYIVAPWISDATQAATIRHSAFVQPWTDRDIHLHTDSEEYYFVFHGQLQLLIQDSIFTIRPYEVLMVKPQVPHAVVGGKGPIEHFVIRLPALDDRQSVGKVPPGLDLATDETQRELQPAWGSRAPLTQARYQNCWLFGGGRARLPSDYMCLAYLSYPTDASADANYWGAHPHRLHLHQKSWEYYTALKGQKVLQIEDQTVEINAGETLEIPPGVRHVAQALHTPYEGFTFRTPRLDDKVEF